MFTGSIHSHAELALTYYHEQLASKLGQVDLISYVGSINQFSPNVLKDVIEKNKTPDIRKLVVLIYSGGGLVETSE